jgi:hypothetical protein
VFCFKSSNTYLAAYLFGLFTLINLSIFIVQARGIFMGQKSNICWVYQILALGDDRSTRLL